MTDTNANGDSAGSHDPLPNIVEIATGSSDFDILVQALTAASLVETIQNATDITVFAPTDAAFTQLAVDLGFTGDQSDETAVFNHIAGALTELAPDDDPIPLLTDILTYHVSPGAKSAAEIDAADEVTTLLADTTFTTEGTELGDKEPDLANPNITTPDVPASNGTVQVIDRVLLPLDIPGNTLPNIVEIATGSSDFDILVQALTAAGLVETIQNATDITVFAPTDAAFTQLAVDLGFTGDQSDETAVFNHIAGALTELAPDDDPIPLLTDILTYHVSPGAKSAAEIDAADEITTLLTDTTFTTEGTELGDKEPDIANPNIVTPDLPASNGTVQVIDRVLLPLDIPGNTTGDQIILPEGVRTVKGAFEDLVGDTLIDFGVDDFLIIDDADLDRSEIEVSGAPTVLAIDEDGDGSADGEITFEGDFSAGDFMAVEGEEGTVISFETFFPAVSEGSALAVPANGINNQAFLTGTGSIGFELTLESTLAQAAFRNSLGVYEVDDSDQITDVRLVTNDVTEGGTFTISDVEDDREVGFFIVQDGADWADSLAMTDTLAFNTAGNLTVNGADAGQTVFHSFDRDLNPGDLEHAISGVVAGGEAITIGFEDLIGGGDLDFQDVVFTVAQFDLS